MAYSFREVFFIDQKRVHLTDVGVEKLCCLFFNAELKIPYQKSLLFSIWVSVFLSPQPSALNFGLQVPHLFIFQKAFCILKLSILKQRQRCDGVSEYELFMNWNVIYSAT